MRTLVQVAPIMALMIAALPTAAQAAEWSGQAPFAEVAVADLELADQRGGFGGTSFGLTAGTFKRLVDVEARDASRMMGAVSRISMDVWWSTTGAEMIATNVRAAQM